MLYIIYIAIYIDIYIYTDAKYPLPTHPPGASCNYLSRTMPLDRQIDSDCLTRRKHNLTLHIVVTKVRGGGVNWKIYETKKPKSIK